jgi:hypothetical protein
MAFLEFRHRLILLLHPPAVHISPDVSWCDGQLNTHNLCCRPAVGGIVHLSSKAYDWMHAVNAAFRQVLEPAAGHLSVLAQQEARRSSQQQRKQWRAAADVPRDSIIAIGDQIRDGNAYGHVVPLLWEAVSAITRHSLTGEELSQLYSVCKRTARGGHRGAGGDTALYHSLLASDKPAVPYCCGLDAGLLAAPPGVPEPSSMERSSWHLHLHAFARGRVARGVGCKYA